MQGGGPPRWRAPPCCCSTPHSRHTPLGRSFCTSRGSYRRSVPPHPAPPSVISPAAAPSHFYCSSSPPIRTVPTVDRVLRRSSSRPVSAPRAFFLHRVREFDRELRCNR